MGPSVRGRGKKGHNKKFGKKEKVVNPNDIPLGPRIPFSSDGDANGSVGGKPLIGGNGQGKSNGKWDKQKNSKNKDEEVKFNPKSKKAIDEKKEVARLTKLLEEVNIQLILNFGLIFFKRLWRVVILFKGPHVEPSAVKSFKDLPLSKKTLMGLRDSEYQEPTEIQRESIGLALRGLDILGAAKTGSGKTLAFIIPVIAICKQ